MGRRKKLRDLAVWMNGELVGRWRRDSRGVHEFTYAESWFGSPAARPISLSMPLRPSTEPYRAGVEAFFDNLLPDNRQIRERIQRRFRAPSPAAFDLLAEIGRDCVGAIQLLPPDQKPGNIHRITAKPLSTKDIAAILTFQSTFPLSHADLDDFRISLAGAQEKTALLLHNGSWHVPTGATPTTHILKLPLGANPQGIDLSTSVENEWLCSQIVRAYGVETTQCSIESFADQKTLVVERFDRRLASNGKWLLRLPQEDFCQATATPPALKYENDGGPGIRGIMDVLFGSDHPAEDRRAFMRAQLLFWMLAAIDGHAKNFSIFLHAGGAYKLTPLYDILSAYPVLGHGRGKLAPRKIKMAMAVHGKSRHYRWIEISVRHWLQTAKTCGLSDMKNLLEETITQTPAVIQKVHSLIPRRFPAQIADSILAGLADAAKRLKSELASL